MKSKQSIAKDIRERGFSRYCDDKGIVFEFPTGKKGHNFKFRRLYGRWAFDSEGDFTAALNYAKQCDNESAVAVLFSVIARYF
jgi:hypothetical protein